MLTIRFQLELLGNIFRPKKKKNKTGVQETMINLNGLIASLW